MLLKSQKKRVIVLGSTGSIGINALDVMKAFKDQFKVVGLSCHQAVEELVSQAKDFWPEAVAIADQESTLKDEKFAPRIYYSDQGILDMLRDHDADIVVNGISGAKGLLPSVEALNTGKNLALANKETVVMAGKLVLEVARKKKLKIIPVDSEHSAIFQLLQNIPPGHVDEVILTASGGAFRDFEVSDLQNVTVRDALKHPNWKMGRKITIDSATMANKGLEIMEAQIFFNLDISKIKVVIHPQSVVHSLVKTIDGTYYAQLGLPDMRIPIQNALSYPEMLPNQFKKFDLTAQPLSFIPVDFTRYKMLAVAYKVAREGGAYPIIYNAANEIAVEAFLKNRISFLQIPQLVQNILDFEWKNAVATIEDIMYIDKEVRIKAQCIVDYKYAK